MQPQLLVLENFQSLRERTEIPIGPITFLYGPNSAGKSCVDDALTLLSTLLVGPQRSDDSFRQMFRRWVHAPQAQEGIDDKQHVKTCLALHCKIGHIFDETSEVGSFGQIDESNTGLLGWFSKADWNIVIKLEGDQSGVLSLSLSAGSECIFRTINSEDGTYSTTLEISRKAFGSTFNDLADKHFVDIKKRLRTYKVPCEMVIDPTPVLSIFRGGDLDRDLVSIVNAMLTDLKLLQIAPLNLGADRSTIRNSALTKICSGGYLGGDFWHRDGLPHSYYDAPTLDVKTFSGSGVEFMGDLADSTYESAYREINKPPPLSNLATLLIEEFPDDGPEGTSTLDFQTQSAEKLHVFVNRCLRDHLFLDQGYQLVFEALEIKPATEIDEPPLSAALMIGSLVDKTGRRMTFEDVGTGISCVIPVLVAVHSGHGFIQQPELHLHPALQSALGDVFVEAAKNQHAYHFVETHSEYILLRCLRRIRETTVGKHPAGNPLALRPEDLSVLYFEPQSDGCTKVKRIRISTHGDFIDRWPRGFFEERGKELFDE